MLTQKINKVIIEGILNELTVRKADKDGKKYIALDASIDVGDGNIVTTKSFAFEKKNDGGLNKIYKSLLTIEENYVSSMAAGIDAATRVRLTSAELQGGDFYTQDGRLVKTFRVRNTFFSRHPEMNFTPRAQFQIDVFILDILEEEDKEGVPTGNLIIEGAVVKYGGKIDKLLFLVNTQMGVKFVKEHYQPGMTVNLQGDIVTKREEITTTKEVGFGTPVENKSIRTEKQLVVTAGTEALDDEWDKNEMREAIIEYNKYMESQKAQALSKTSDSSGGSSTSKKSGFNF